MFVLKPGFTSIVCMHLERVFTDGNLKILCRSLYVLGLECSSDKAKALSLGVHLYPLFLTLLMRSWHNTKSRVGPEKYSESSAANLSIFCFLVSLDLSISLGTESIFFRSLWICVLPLQPGVVSTPCLESIAVSLQEWQQDVQFCPCHEHPKLKGLDHNVPLVSKKNNAIYTDHDEQSMSYYYYYYFYYY